MDEAQFLRLRMEREEARATRQAAESSEDVVARERFVQEVTRISQEVEKLTAAGEASDPEAAMGAYRTLQSHIQHAADVLRLPPHEIKTANATLARCLAQVEEARNATKPVKKFKFSKKKSTPLADAALLTPSTVSGEGESGAASAVATANADPALTYADRADCTVFVAHGKAAFVRHLKRCVVVALPIAGSFFLSDCEGCTVYAACHQMRIKACVDCSVYVWCSSTPVIEGSRDIRFGPYTAWTGLLRTPPPPHLFPVRSEVSDDAAAAAIVAGVSTHEGWVRSLGQISDVDHAKRSFRKVDDFDWLKQQQSPHWRVLDDWEVKDCDVVFEHGQLDAPVQPPLPKAS